jgi:hypothetical protein
MQPELPDTSSPSSCSSANQQQQEQQQQMHFDRVAEAQRAGIHSTLVLAIYDLQASSSGSSSGSDTECYPVAVFELAQHEPDVDFRTAVTVLSKACWVRLFFSASTTCALFALHASCASCCAIAHLTCPLLFAILQRSKCHRHGLIFCT